MVLLNVCHHVASFIKGIPGYQFRKNDPSVTWIEILFKRTAKTIKSELLRAHLTW